MSQKSPRSRANYSEEKKEELRKVNRERARQRRALMTEEEKQLVRVRQRLNTRKKREAERQRQKEIREEQAQQASSKPNKKNKKGNMMSNHTPSSSSILGSLNIPHPQSFAHPIPQRHQQLNQHQGNMSGPWSTSSLNAMASPGSIPVSYQRPGQIHPDPHNLMTSPQSPYSPQRYDVNEFNDRIQMQNQLKITMNSLEDCVRRVTALEKDVLTWKTKFEIEKERTDGIEQWVQEQFGVNLKMKKSQPPSKAKVTKPRAKRQRKKKEPAAPPPPPPDRFPMANNEPEVTNPPVQDPDNNMWTSYLGPLAPPVQNTAINMGMGSGIPYNPLNMPNNIPSFNTGKDEAIDLFSQTINPNSSIISYK